MLHASFPEQSSVLLIGSPGIGTLEFNVFLAKDYLDRGDTVVFVAIDNAPADLVALMDLFGVQTKEQLGKRLFFLDYNSALLGFSEQRGVRQSEIRSISDLEGIMFNIAAISQETGKKLRIFLYSLSTLFLYNQANVVLKFFQISTSKIKSDFGSVVVSLHDGVHDDKTVNHLMAIADGVIELQFDDELNKMMRIRHMRGVPTSPDWVPFEIRNSGSNAPVRILEWR